MDMMTGKTYKTKEDALADGVPESDLAFYGLDDSGNIKPETVQVSSGPFKGRTYKRNGLGQLVRVR